MLTKFAVFAVAATMNVANADIGASVADIVAEDAFKVDAAKLSEDAALDDLDNEEEAMPEMPEGMGGMPSPVELAKQVRQMLEDPQMKDMFPKDLDLAKMFTVNEAGEEELDMEELMKTMGAGAPEESDL